MRFRAESDDLPGQRRVGGGAVRIPRGAVIFTDESSACDFPGARASRPQRAGGPRCSSGQDARAPRNGTTCLVGLRRSLASACDFPGARASRPQRAGGPRCSSGQDARAPRNGTTCLVGLRRSLASACDFPGARASRPQRAGGPRCSSGQDARAPRNGTTCLVGLRRSLASACDFPGARASRPQRAGGPRMSELPRAPDCSSGQDARAPGNGTTCLVGRRRYLARLSGRPSRSAGRRR